MIIHPLVCSSDGVNAPLGVIKLWRLCQGTEGSLSFSLTTKLKACRFRKRAAVHQKTEMKFGARDTCAAIDGYSNLLHLFPPKHTRDLKQWTFLRESLSLALHEKILWSPT